MTTTATATTSRATFPAVARVYSGRPGCACGCRGTYSTSPAMVTRVVHALLANAAQVQVDTDLDGGMMFFVDTATRAYTVYCR